VARKEGRESVACPDPHTHLSKPPRYEREDGEPWRLVQDLPAAPIAPPNVGRKATYLVASLNGTTSIVQVRPRVYWRCLVGPLIQLLAAVYILALAVHLRPGESVPSGLKVVLTVAVLSFGGMAWNSLGTVEGSELFEIDPVQRRVTQRRFL
jgi:hypothetical protein